MHVAVDKAVVSNPDKGVKAKNADEHEEEILGQTSEGKGDHHKMGDKPKKNHKKAEGGKHQTAHKGEGEKVTHEGEHDPHEGEVVAEKVEGEGGHGEGETVEEEAPVETEEERLAREAEEAEKQRVRITIYNRVSDLFDVGHRSCVSYLKSVNLTSAPALSNLCVWNFLTTWSQSQGIFIPEYRNYKISNNVKHSNKTGCDNDNNINKNNNDNIYWNRTHSCECFEGNLLRFRNYSSERPEAKFYVKPLIYNLSCSGSFYKECV